MLLFLCASIFAQKNAINVQAKLSEDYKTLSVSQDITYFNTKNVAVKEVNLLNWIAAYQSKGTSLSDRKLENRDRDLHFAKKDELGKLNNLTINIDDYSFSDFKKLTKENISIPLNKSLEPNESTDIHLEYTLSLPSIKFTGYGTSANKVALKYFFLIPDSFENEDFANKEFLDIEETSSFDVNWQINLELPNGEFSESNLAQIVPNSFKGILKTDPEIFISKAPFLKLNSIVKGKNVEIVFGYSLSEEELQNLEFYIPLHLSFIEEKTGALPEKIFISEKFKNKEEFLGNNNIKFLQFDLPLFTEKEQIDLDYFSLLSQKVLEESFAIDKNKNHFFANGLQTYLEIQYLKKFYSDSKLLGTLPETKLLGIQPLKLFHASEIKLLERYGIAYQYMMTQNLDQKIDEPFEKLSNFNEMAISNFEMGTLFNFVSERIGSDKFNLILKDYLIKNKDLPINPNDFLDQLVLQNKESTSFLKEYITKKQRVNFKIKSFEKVDDKLQIRVKKNSKLPVPFKIETYAKNGDVHEYWFDTEAEKTDKFYEIPESDAYKIVINNESLFPESSFRDNYLYTKGLFSNMKKIKLKLIKDIPNPEYNEIYLNPRIDFNAYDKVLIGLNFKNKSLFDQNFEYSATPYFSSGTGKITGSGGIVYKILPKDSFFRSLNLGVSGTYFHYDYDLTYQKYSAFANMDLKKEPRSAIGRTFFLSYNHFEKELSPELIAKNDYDQYNLFNVGFRYSDNKLINEKQFSINYQLMEDYNKISAEGFYRWEFAKNRKMSFRLFGGYFMQNNTRNTNFNFGISRVSNYTFSYNLVGQSATTGLLSQQFILADGGFKSFINGSANQWISSANVDTQVWKMFDIYADAGIYKNKNLPSKFIYDSGVKVRIIPDFLEVFLPVYSTLGFEPGFKDYASRIRFSLVLNFSAFVGALRRGWY